LVSFTHFGHFQENSSRLHFSVFGALFWIRLLAPTITNYQYQNKSLTIDFWRRNLGQKSYFSKIWNKSDFLGFTPKPLPILDFALDTNLFETLLSTF